MAQEQVNLVVQATDQATATLRKVSGEVDGLGKSMKSFTDKAKEFGQVMAAAGAAVAAFGIKSVNTFATVGDEIEKMARRTGLTAETVSVLRFAADQAGTSIQAVEIGIKTMQRTMVDASAGSETLTETFKRLGFSIEEIRAMTPEQQFQELGVAIGQIPDPAERTALALDVFGKSGTDLIPLFEEMKGGMGEVTDRAKKLGVVMDSETAAKAAKLNDTMGELKAQLLGVQLQIGEALMPVVVKMNEEWLPASITAWQNLDENLKGIWQDMKTTVVTVFDSIKNAISSTINGILAQIQSVIDAWNRMKAALSQSVSGVGTAFKNLPANLGFRAEGGPVSSGSPYIVGERGPELFVPGASGAIVPNHALAGAGAVNVYISGNNISSDMDLREISRKVGEEIVRTLKLNTRI